MVTHLGSPSASRQDTGLALIARSLSLSLGAALALGVARFSYALLLPAMKADLGWTFAQAGALNTANAAGYLGGALLFPALTRRFEVSHVLLAGCVLATLSMALAGYTAEFNGLLALRLACGIFSALVFVGGGMQAARLAAAHPARSGLVLGLFYSGAGWGIVLSTLIVPWTLSEGAHGWQAPWVALAVGCAVCSALVWPTALGISSETAAATGGESANDNGALRLGRMMLLLTAYGLFGVGYIGYMTFIVALLRGAGLSSFTVDAFYVALGVAAAASGNIWARVLNRARGGEAFALFSLLLSIATFIPAITSSPVAAFVSGLAFGGTFVSVVTATTVFVRHNLPRAKWSAGISAFTIVFAIGQIAGPVIMGQISDGANLSRGFLYSAGILLLGAVIAAGQRPLIKQTG